MTRFGTLLALPLCAAALALGACGEDEETIGSAEYITQCEDQLKLQQSELIGEEQAAQICKCTQDKLVEQGLGDRGLDDESLRDEGEKVGRDCALEVIQGAQGKGDTNGDAG